MSGETPLPFTSAAEVEELLAGFLAATLSRKQWTHAAHIAVATWHAKHYGPAEALDRVRAGILRLNAANGVEQTTTGGYHETLTRFYMWAVGAAVERAPRDLAIDALANRVIAECGDRKLPLRYYSEAVLSSWPARTSWVEPDLGPLAQ